MAIEDEFKAWENLREIWPDNAYRGLWGEVVASDIYRIKQLKFVPDVIFDIGANVGTFSKFCRELFPDAVIVAIEPDDDNIANFKKYHSPSENNIILYHCAIGIGQAYRDLKSANGSHECYLSKFMGYEGIGENEILGKSPVRTILLDEIDKGILIDNQKYIIKIDIEGSETAIFTHEASMAILRNADYIAMELHYFAMTPGGVLEVTDMTNKVIDSFKETHDTEYVHPMFYATKK